MARNNKHNNNKHTGRSNRSGNRPAVTDQKTRGVGVSGDSALSAITNSAALVPGFKPYGVPYSLRIGSLAPGGAVSIDDRFTKWTKPTTAILAAVPFFGAADGTDASPINACMNRVWQKLRTKITGSYMPFTAGAVAMYLADLDGIYIRLAEILRALKVSLLPQNYMNVGVPDAIMEACGYGLRMGSVRNVYMDKYNYALSRMAAFAIPQDFTLLHRHVGFVTNILADEASAGAQYIVPRYFAYPYADWAANKIKYRKIATSSENYHYTSSSTYALSEPEGYSTKLDELVASVNAFAAREDNYIISNYLMSIEIAGQGNILPPFTTDIDINDLITEMPEAMKFGIVNATLLPISPALAEGVVYSEIQRADNLGAWTCNLTTEGIDTEVPTGVAEAAYRKAVASMCLNTQVHTPLDCFGDNAVNPDPYAAISFRGEFTYDQTPGDDREPCVKATFLPPVCLTNIFIKDITVGRGPGEYGKFYAVVNMANAALGYAVDEADVYCGINRGLGTFACLPRINSVRVSALGNGNRDVSVSQVQLCPLDYHNMFYMYEHDYERLNYALWLNLWNIV